MGQSIHEVPFESLLPAVDTSSYPHVRFHTIGSSEIENLLTRQRLELAEIGYSLSLVEGRSASIEVEHQAEAHNRAHAFLAIKREESGEGDSKVQRLRGLGKGGNVLAREVLFQRGIPTFSSLDARSRGAQENVTNTNAALPPSLQEDHHF